MAYLDYNSTTPVDSRIVEIMIPIFNERFGNPSSVGHETGRAAGSLVEDARRYLAGEGRRLTGAGPSLLQAAPRSDGRTGAHCSAGMVRTQYHESLQNASSAMRSGAKLIHKSSNNSGALPRIENYVGLRIESIIKYGPRLKHARVVTCKRQTKPIQSSSAFLILPTHHSGRFRTSVSHSLRTKLPCVLRARLTFLSLFLLDSMCFTQ